MYFTKIRLGGRSTIDLPIVGLTPSSRYILKNADGLGPTEVDVSFSTSIHSGGVYHGRRPQDREMVFRIGLNPDYATNQTPADMRETLYGVLSPNTSDALVVYIMNNDTIVMMTVGYVKKFEIVPFTKTPEVQITIACPEPYFQAGADTLVTGLSTSLPLVTNPGNAETGFYMEVVFTAALGTWQFSRNSTGEHLGVVYSFASGDKLTVDTRTGSRGIWVTDGGGKKSIIYALASYSVWHKLMPGDNQFATNSSAFTWAAFSYRPKYWGI